MTHPRDSFCDQSTYEMMRVSSSGMRDVLKLLCAELDNREPCPGEVSLLSDMERAAWTTERCCRRIEAHICEELHYGRERHPQQYASEEDYPNTADSEDESTQA